MNLYNYYNQQIADNESKYSDFSKRFMTVVYLRLVIFIAVVLILYYFWSQSAIVLPAIIIGLGYFGYLVKKAEDLKYKKLFYQQMVVINKEELLAQDEVYTQFKDGSKYIDPSHKYSYDIDMFGPGSFFQFINRTVTSGGEMLLARGLSTGNFNNISQRQAAIAELSDKTDWNQEFIATGSLIETDLSDEEAVDWLQAYQSVIPKLAIVPMMMFAFVSAIVIGLVTLSFIPNVIAYLCLFIGIGISAIFLKRINAIHGDSTNLTQTLKQYTKLLILIENQTFDTPYLQQITNRIKDKNLASSTELHHLYKIFNSLDSRSNVMISIFLNGFFLKDLFVVSRLDNWMIKNQSSVKHWFETIYQMDEMISCAVYDYNHPGHCYPSLSDDDCLFEAIELGHPLIKSSKRVNNNFSTKFQHFTIITGANMAGKSTFLRALGINMALANNGMPVCATEMKFIPTPIISSMRTTDSLNKDESYFFSELKRLKFIVDTCKTTAHLIILDEILKGTNSKDKAEGSWKFLERMRTSGSTGIIATHDLSLCELPGVYPIFNNQCFDAEIIKDELYFDYKLKPGRCRNMNASFLLKKMDII